MRLPGRILLRYFNLNMVEYFRLVMFSFDGLTLKMKILFGLINLQVGQSKRMPVFVANLIFLGVLLGLGLMV